MPLIPHTFDPNKHMYQVDGDFVLSTSAVIELNGLSDMSMVPKDALEFASHRGSALHLAVMAYETDCSPEDAVEGYDALHETNVADAAMERFRFYLRWRENHEVKLAGKMEQTRVYRHEGTEICIGTTIDMPCYIDGIFTVVDLKTSHKQYGQKHKQDCLKWKLQLQSYREALEAEGALPEKTMILHLHKDCGKTGVKGEALGYEEHYQPECGHAWHSAITMALEKLSAGYKLQDRS
jgi:hypothetical protein